METFTVAGGGDRAQILCEEAAWKGVRRVAGKVASDIGLVTGKDADVRIFDAGQERAQSGAGIPELLAGNIFAGTAGRSAVLDELEETGVLDLSGVRGKREVYAFRIVSLPEGISGAGERTALIIAGSDKRGTIYGLFHLSERIGVSPWVWFADAAPAKRESITLAESDNLVTKEPSVKYRGLFINDEWPSFGSWTYEHFEGFTAKMYDHVFELILRLKGNYLWPAMWSSSFSLDGPGLASAELADEYGIVMSNSHHEPCLRHSEEWDKVKGADSGYGTEWNFDRNREGLANYWRDGLLRNGKLENIITVGMRGERDSEVLGHTASLRENIDYLKEVITTQNELIRETVGAEQGKELSEIPRMLAIYKEVEDYFYGDEYTEGLRTWEGLNGITCMLCEDNFGNMRRLPSAEERGRTGGWGMYYHFDYHGDPVSYEWVNSTYLPKVWEQLGQAYESGVREIWIVNVGDLKPQELPLSYFLELAYDYEKWGSGNPRSAEEYLRHWTEQQFGQMGGEVCSEIEALLDGYTRLNSVRKPEALWADTYHPANYGEAGMVSMLAGDLAERAERLRASFSGTPLSDAYEELVYFPVCASMNLLQMQLTAGRNALLARQGRPSANACACELDAHMARDEALREQYHRLAGGKWSGLMKSEHIGFRHWNDEEAGYPVRQFIYPSRKERLVVSLADREESTCGGDWTRRPLYVTGFLKPNCKARAVMLENAGAEEIHWTARSTADWLLPGKTEGVLVTFDSVSVDENAPMAPFFIDTLAIRVDEDALARAAEAESEEHPAFDRVLSGSIWIETGFSKAEIVVLAKAFTEEEREAAHYIPVLPERYEGRVHPGYRPGILPSTKSHYDRGDDLGLALEASEYAQIHDAGGAGFRILKPFGKYDSALKAFPVTEAFAPDKLADTAPSVTYEVYLPEDGEYELTLLTAPSNPVDPDYPLRLGLQFGSGEARTEVQTISTVGMGYRGGDRTCNEWALGVLDQIHKKATTFLGKRGRMELTVYACDPGVVLERLLVRKADSHWAEGYIGLLPEWIKGKQVSFRAR